MASSVFLVTFRRASVFWWLKWESNSRAPSSNTSISFFFLEIVIKGRRPAPALREEVKASEFSSFLFAVTKWEKLREMGTEGHILQLKKKIKINWCNGKESTCQRRKHKTHNRLISGSGRSPGGGNCNPLQCSCLENPMDRGAWWATVHDVAKSQIGLSLHIRTYTQVSSHSNVILLMKWGHQRIGRGHWGNKVAWWNLSSLTCGNRRRGRKYAKTRQGLGARCWLSGFSLSPTTTNPWGAASLLCFSLSLSVP